MSIRTSARPDQTHLAAMRLPGLDGILAISISLVLLFHLATSAAGHPVLGFGIFGVDIFFVVSGFLITWLLCREETEHSSISLQAFYVRHALRILPPELLILGFCFSCHPLTYFP